MAKLGTVKFRGASGTEYPFTAYSRDHVFEPIGAVYFVTRRERSEDGTHGHVRIYLGQTGDLAHRPFDHKTPCFDEHGADCLCVHAEPSESKRVNIESDLVHAFKPPCND
jgi:hypothetical protein